MPSVFIDQEILEDDGNSSMVLESDQYSGCPSTPNIKIKFSEKNDKLKEF